MSRLVLLTAMAVVAFSVLLSAGPTARADHGGSGHLSVCCAWGTAISDGTLTYNVSGATGDALTEINEAITAWNDALTSQGVGLALVPAANAKDADIKIKFKRGGGAIAGQALRKFDRQGFVKSCDLQLSGMAFGQSALDTLEEVATHELGHCLGLGHADFDNDLMSPTVNGVKTITSCHIEGVKEANHWKLVDGDTTPHPPHVTSVDCP